MRCILQTSNRYSGHFAVSGNQTVRAMSPPASKYYIMAKHTKYSFRGCDEMQYKRRASQLAFSIRDAAVSGTRINKKQLRSQLAPRLHNRTDKAIEYKLGNVSAALIELVLAPVPGYAPYGNRQQALLDEVERQAVQRGELPSNR
jgi:hypothetical protein